jgi:hypothetical protein
MTALQSPGGRLAAAVAASLVVLSAAPCSQDSVLIRIGKRQPASVSSALMAQMTPLQELASAWLVEVPAPLVARLTTLRLSFDTLDWSTAGKAYYLVFAPDAEHIEGLAVVGEVRIVDEGVGLFWSGAEDAREIVPAEVSLKRLSGRIRTPVSFLSPARGRAIERALAMQRFLPFDARIAEMVDQVSQTRLSALVAGLQSFQTRYASTSNCEEAGAAIYDAFQQSGLQTEADSFTFSANAYTSSNIIATIPGQVAPGRVVIVCAHYDSTSSQARTAAPGADDNASGTAAVMEIARVLAPYQFDFTVKFIAFSAEEWGLYGSKHYAAAARQRGENIIGVVDLDMIGYADALPEDLDLFVNDRSDWLGDAYIAAANRYAPLGLTKRINPSVTGSDHSPFWDQGYSALVGIEDYPLRNPNYHKPADTIDTLNLEFATAVARASAAAVAELAQPTNPLAAPTGVQLRAQIVRSLFTSRKMVVLTWNASPGSIAGYNVYRSPVSHGQYQRVRCVAHQAARTVRRSVPAIECDGQLRRNCRGHRRAGEQLLGRGEVDGEQTRPRGRHAPGGGPAARAAHGTTRAAAARGRAGHDRRDAALTRRRAGPVSRFVHARDDRGRCPRLLAVLRVRQRAVRRQGRRGRVRPAAGPGRALFPEAPHDSRSRGRRGGVLRAGWLVSAQGGMSITRYEEQWAAAEIPAATGHAWGFIAGGGVGCRVFGRVWAVGRVEYSYTPIDDVRQTVPTFDLSGLSVSGGVAISF